MTANFVVPEQVVRENGASPSFDLGPERPDSILLTFGITGVLEQQSIDLSFQGSADGENFDPKPIAAFPQKFYCGTYKLHLNLASCPDVRYIRAAWKTNRWGRGDQTPMFNIYVFAEVPDGRAAAAAV